MNKPGFVLMLIIGNGPDVAPTTVELATKEACIWAGQSFLAATVPVNARQALCIDQTTGAVEIIKPHQPATEKTQ